MASSDALSPRTGADWLVGATFNGTDDQTPRFLRDGIWENGYEDRYLDLVKSMRPGDRIAIKSSYVRKNELPFDNRGNFVSTLAIKAIGTVVENLNDGRRVKVTWTSVQPPREWYFYTNRSTVWRIQAGHDPASDALTAFVFDGASQDIERFRNEPFWRERFGASATVETEFGWTNFYEAIADGLLRFRSDRNELVAGLRSIADRVDWLRHLSVDRYPDGTQGFVRDICPFTTIGIFNRGLRDAHRITLASELAAFVGVDLPVPTSFAGIPVLNNQNSWFFVFEKERPQGQIDSLWNVFETGLALANSDTDDSRSEFASAFDNAMLYPGVAWNLTFGLYWARPWAFPSLDQRTRPYLEDRLLVPIERNGPKRRSSATDYLKVKDSLEHLFRSETYPVHSFPDLSLEAWRYKPPIGTAQDKPAAQDAREEPEADMELADNQTDEPSIPLYDLDSVQADGCFLEPAELKNLLDRLREKKNLILQGPPGTGKTWLARRLAYALMGQRDDSRVRAVQFHQNLSYEDFVRGWRPTERGLQLTDGIFMEAIGAAKRDPTRAVVVVIEEVNRGNPAQIFGELLTLLEASKRTPSEAVELCYADADGVRRPVHIPKNLYVIGTMNVADRSLALVDFALRRRFAFANLEPMLGQRWKTWVVAKCGVAIDLADDIKSRISELNSLIENDPRLGKQFQIGHSYVTPVEPLEANDTKRWYQQVVETEIGPLLDEYWFDAPAEAQRARTLLLRGW